LVGVLYPVFLIAVPLAPSMSSCSGTHVPRIARQCLASLARTTETRLRNLGDLLCPGQKLPVDHASFAAAAAWHSECGRVCTGPRQRLFAFTVSDCSFKGN
jgi:hypothetical protein